MFNLLPQQDQRDLVSDYRLRFAVISLLLFCALGTVALAALAPTFLLSYQKEIFTKNIVNVLKNDSMERSKDRLADTLSFTAKEIKVLSTVGSAAYSYELIAEVIQNKTEEVKLTGIRVSRGESDASDIVVTGEARDRDTLLSFVRILEKEKSFSSVTVPVSNFAAAADINFSILIKAK